MLNSPAVYVVSADGFEATLDISAQILRLDVLEEVADGPGGESVPAEIYPSLAGSDWSRSFLSASLLGFKAKQFDDGLYAAVELALDEGCEKYSSKNKFLSKLLESLVKGGAEGANLEASALLAAAAQLGGQEIEIPADVAQKADEIKNDFLEKEIRSKPLGFYTWDPRLQRIFQRDRMLQEKCDSSTAQTLARLLSKDEDSANAYNAWLRLAERLTNPWPPGWSDFREVLAAITKDQEPNFQGDFSLFPPSRSHETELVKSLYGDRPIPEGFDLADEMVCRIQDGRLRLEPGPDSGWYDHQTYALEPLAIPEKTPEAEHFSFTDSYRKELAALFKAMLGLTRETHIKQLEVPVCFATPDSERMKPRITIRPRLSIEPLGTFYSRRAMSYAFVSNVLEEFFGIDSLRQMHRLTASGPVETPLFEELRFMEGLFYGAYLVVCDELGMVVELGEEPERNINLTTGRKIIEDWAESVKKERDSDVSTDLRMMVPVFYDLQSGKTKVWCVLGLAMRPVSVSYQREPVVREVRDSQGDIVNPNSVDVEFESVRHDLVYLVTAEAYVDRVLNREEFRRHCDRHKTQNEIIRNLHSR